MTRSSKVILACVAAVSMYSAVGQENYSNYVPPPLAAFLQIVHDTWFLTCANHNEGDDCCWECGTCDYEYSGYDKTEPAQPGDMQGHQFYASLVDNNSFQHIHTAFDYRAASSASGCCGGSGGDSNNLPRFSLKRIHRYRDVSYPSNFGIGAYTNFDAKLFLYTLPDGSTLIDLLDPNMLNIQKFVDGPYTHPFNPNDPKDGTYVSYRTHSHAGIQLLDINGVPATNQANAVKGVLTSWNGKKFTFQIVSIDGQRVGRLTRIDDRNGYGVGLTYKFNPGDNLGGSESKLWEINTVTDAYGKQATFTYGSTPVGGRWTITSVALPNGTSVSYSYAADGYLSGVSYPTGEQSTFTRTFDATSNCTIVNYFDAGATGIHRAKKTYLTTNFTYNTTLPDDIIPQSASLVRLITNGAGELAYCNLPQADDGGLFVFEGNNVVKKLNAGTMVRYCHDWDLTRADGATWSFDSVTPYYESTYEKLVFASYNEPWYQGTPTSRILPNGMQINYTFNSASNVATRTYPDGSVEQYSYNGFQQVTQYVDRDNRVTQYQYDARGNRTLKKTGLLLQGGNVVTTPETATWTWSYYPAGNANQFLLSQSIDANSHVTDYAYDANHFLVSVTQPADITGGTRGVTSYLYDAPGSLSRMTDPFGRVTDYAYDLRRRPNLITHHTYPAYSTEQFAYYTTESGGVNANLLKSKIDQNGDATSYDYDLAGRQITEHLASGTAVEGIKTCAYVPGTELRSSCVNLGNTTTYAYDFRQRATSQTVKPRAAKTLTQSWTYTNNMLTKETDYYGRRTYYLYDVNFRPVHVGRELTVGGLSSFTTATARMLTNNPLYAIEDTTFDAVGQVLSRVDGNGVTQTSQYDSRGRLVSQVNADSVWNGTAFVVAPEGTKTRYEYDAQGNRTKVVHPRSFTRNAGTGVFTEVGGYATVFTYTNRNLLKSVTEGFGSPVAATESYTYYLDGQVQDTTDARGKVWTTKWRSCCPILAAKFDPSAKVDTTGTNKFGATIFGTDYAKNPTYEGRAALLTSADTEFTEDFRRNPDDAKTFNEVTTHYDQRNRPDAKTVWLTALPPAAGNAWLGVDGRGYKGGDANTPANFLKTTYVYDENLTDGVGLDATYATQLASLGAGYFGAGGVGSAVEATDPLGNKTVTVYDGIGRTVMTIDGNLNTVRIGYDGLAENLLETTETDMAGRINRSRAAADGRVRKTLDHDARATTYAYDPNGNLKQVRDPNSVGFDTTVDALNRELTRTDTQGDRVAYREFDANSNVTKTKDALNQQTVYVYDARNRKTDGTDRISGTTHYVYDANSNLTSITDAETRVTSYVYDARNLLTAETFPLGQFADADTNGDSYPDARTRVYVYDASRRLASRLDQKLALTGYAYDMANRITQRSYPTPTAADTFTYDNASRLLTAASGQYANTVTRTYDPAHRLLSETLSVNAKNYPVSYGYNTLNLQTSVTYPNAAVLTRAFTTRNQLQTVTYAGSTVATLAYDIGMRQTTKTFGNSKVETRTYTPRLDNLPVSIATPAVTTFGYSWDANKRKTAQTDSGIPANDDGYSYDNEDRLTGFTRTNGDSQSWNLTKVGDWTQFTANGTPQNRTHDNVHELVSINGTSLVYDAKGDLTQNSNGQTYTWDIENRLAGAVVPGSPATNASYTYDALGRRVSKTVNGTTTIFVNDGLQEIAEYDSAALPANPLRVYAFGSYIDEPLMMLAGGVKSYYHANSLYSVGALTNAAGAVVERYTYDPYGKVKILAPDGVTVRTASSVGNSLFWQGGRQDLETGLYQKRARYYSAELGRFISRDPLEYVDGANMYSGYFVPNGLDPTGLWTWPWWRSITYITFNVVTNTTTQQSTGAFIEDGRVCDIYGPDSYCKCYEICNVYGHQKVSSWTEFTVETFLLNSTQKGYVEVVTVITDASGMGAGAYGTTNGIIRLATGAAELPSSLPILAAIGGFKAGTKFAEKTNILEKAESLGLHKLIGSETSSTITSEHTTKKEVPCPKSSGSSNRTGGPSGSGSGSGGGGGGGGGSGGSGRLGSHMTP